MSTVETRLKKLENHKDELYIVTMDDLLDFDDGTKIPTKKQEEFIEAMMAEDMKGPHYPTVPMPVTCPGGSML